MRRPVVFEGAGSGVLESSAGRRRRVQTDADDASDSGEVGVGGQQTRVKPLGDRRDHAVDETSRSDPGRATASVDTRGGIKVGHGIEGEQFASQQEPPQGDGPRLVSGTGQHLHDDRLGHREAAVTRDQVRDSTVEATARGSIGLHPCRGVRQDHVASCSAASAGAAAIACAPRMASASSRVIG